MRVKRVFRVKRKNPKKGEISWAGVTLKEETTRVDTYTRRNISISLCTIKTIAMSGSVVDRLVVWRSMTGYGRTGKVSVRGFFVQR